MSLSRMKGGIQGLNITQVSLVLIGLVSASVLVLTWTKTQLMTSSIPTNPILHLNPAGPRESSKGKSNSGQSGTRQVETLDSSGIELEVKSTTTENRGIPSSVTGTQSDGLSGIKNQSEGIGTAQENSIPVEREHAGNSSATAKKEIHPITSESKEEVSAGSDNSEQTEIVPESLYTVESSAKKELTKNFSATAENKDCNYAKGKWVFDKNWPLYSGFDCKQWLSAGWACHLTQRKDFEYEKLRWQPKDCTMEEFTGSRFLTRMTNKTLAFVGDSLGRQQFQSLMCMVSGGQEMRDVVDVGHREYGLVQARGASRPDGWAYRFTRTNTTILFYWSSCLCDLERINASNPASGVAMHLDRPPAFLRRFLHKFDVLILNTGHHWNRGKLQANRWVMHVGGVPNTNRKMQTMGAAKDFTVHSIVKWVDSQLPLHPRLKAFFRSISPRHFFNGEWNTGGTCDNTSPRAGDKEVVDDEPSDPLAAGAVNGTNVKLLDITGVSQLRDEGHISRYSLKATPGVQDCLHWCLPGIPDTWNEIMFAQI